MLISVSSAVIDRLGVDAGFAAIKAAGFEAIDFGLNTTWAKLKAEGPLDFYSDEEKVKAYTEEIKAAAKKHGITFGQFHAPYPTWIKDHDRAIEKARFAVIKSIEVCAACGCDKIVVHPNVDGNLDHALPAEEEWELNIAFYSSLIPYLKQYGVTCLLENMFALDLTTKKNYASACSNITEAVEYIDTLNEIAGEKCFGFCLDTGHLVIVGGDLYRAVTALGDRLVALHIHDNDGKDDTHSAPYIGGVTVWAPFLRGLQEMGYKGNLNFETGGALTRFPDELIPSILRLIADTGVYFREQLSGKK